MTRSLRVVQATEVWLPLTQAWLDTLVRTLPVEIESDIMCERASDPDAFPVDRLFVSPPRPWWTGRVGRIMSRSGLAPGDAGLAQLVSWRRPDVIHGHFGHHAWRLVKTANDAGIPILASFYGLDVDYVPSIHPRWHARYGELFDAAATVLVLGPWMASRLKALGCSSSRLEVHHLGVDMRRMRFRLPDPGRHGPVRMLVAAAFREKKGIPDAVRAAGRVADHHDVRLTIIGDRPTDPSAAAERARILATVQETGMGARTRILPMMSHDELATEAESHDVFLAPSRTASNGDTEGTPMTLVDMAAIGLPIVATRHADIPEVVRDGQTGLLADEGDVAGLALHVESIVQDRSLAKALARAGRRHVETEFDAGRQAQRLAAIYRRVGGR